VPVNRPKDVILRKTDIINAVAGCHGFRHFLEIGTPTTGFGFGQVNPTLFERRDRLLYFCPDAFDDGHPVTYRSARARSDDAIALIQQGADDRPRYDLIFVDAHHTYENSLCDLWAAWSLLAPHGVMIVHDCNPKGAHLIAPEYQDGDWCGRTFQAFIDFSLSAHGSGSCVVDTDSGCGIVFGAEAHAPKGLPLTGISVGLAYEWAVAKSSDRTLYPFFNQNRQALLKLISVEDFAPLYDMTVPSRTPPRRSFAARVAGRLKRTLATGA